MNELYSLNVNWGDCHIIKTFEGNHVQATFTVDFGSKSGEKKIKSVISDYKKNYETISENNKYGLLTHYHHDHMNGFLSAIINHKVGYNTFYLPKMIPMQKKKELSPPALLFFFSLMLKPGSQYFNDSKANIRLINELLSNGTSVKLVEKGDAITILSNTYNVLWPDFNELRPEYTSLDTVYKDLELIVDREILDMIDKNLINKYLNHMSLETSEELESEIEEVNARFNERFYNNEKISTLVKEKFFRYLSRRCKSISRNNLNKYSVVLHEEDRILLLADITEGVFDNYIKKEMRSNLKLSGKYLIMKAPHHGTDSGHYSHLFPSCKHIIINNYPTSRYKGVSNSYYLQYKLKNIDHIWCMNEHLNAKCLANNLALSCGVCHSVFIKIMY